MLFYFVFTAGWFTTAVLATIASGFWLSVVSTGSPCVCMGSLVIFWLPSVVQRCLGLVNCNSELHMNIFVCAFVVSVVSYVIHWQLFRLYLAPADAAQ